VVSDPVVSVADVDQGTHHRSLGPCWAWT